MKRKIVSLVLALAMAMGISAVSVFAAPRPSIGGAIRQANQTVSDVVSLGDNLVQLATTPIRVANTIGSQTTTAINNTKQIANAAADTVNTAVNVATSVNNAANQAAAQLNAYAEAQNAANQTAE